MKKPARFLVTSLLIMVALAIKPEGSAGQSSTEKELLDIEREITAMYLNKNVEAFSYNAGEDFSGFHASNPYRFDSKLDVEDALKTFYKYSRVTALYKLQPRVQIYGDTAIVTYHFVETGEAEGGKIYAYEGKQTDVLVRRQGKWSLVHFHSSRVVKPG